MSIETVVIALLVVLVAGLLRSHAEILKRLHALGVGLEPDVPVGDGASRLTPTAGSVSDVEGTGLRDDVIRVAVAGVRHRTLLAFLSSGCLTCRGFWDAFADAAAVERASDARLVIVAKDPGEESVTALRELSPRDVPVVLSSATWKSYRVPGAPYFVLVDGPTTAILGEGTGATWDQVTNLLRHSTGDSRERLIDRELLTHGIGPDHASLYPTAHDATSTTPQ